MKAAYNRVYMTDDVKFVVDKSNKMFLSKFNAEKVFIVDLSGSCIFGSFNRFWPSCLSSTTMKMFATHAFFEDNFNKGGIEIDSSIPILEKINSYLYGKIDRDVAILMHQLGWSAEWRNFGLSPIESMLHSKCDGSHFGGHNPDLPNHIFYRTSKNMTEENDEQIKVATAHINKVLQYTHHKMMTNWTRKYGTQMEKDAIAQSEMGEDEKLAKKNADLAALEGNTAEEDTKVE